MSPETRLTPKEDRGLGTFNLRKVGVTNRVLGTCTWCTRLNHDIFLVTSPTGYTSQQYPSQQYPSSQQYSSSQQHPPSQQYSSSQPSATPTRRSTLATTPTYGHASLPSHPPAPPHLSGSDPYNPSFPVPIRHPSNNPSEPPPPAPQPIAHRAATMSIPVPAHTTSSMPYDMQSPNTMYSSSQPGIMGGSKPTAQGYSYCASTVVEFLTVHAHNKRLTAEVHARNDDRRNFSDENLEQSREGTRHSGEYMREKGRPNHMAAGIPQQELVRCMICRRVTTRVAAESRRWYCTGGHMGVWQLVVIILSLYKTNKWMPLCPMTVDPHDEDRRITHYRLPCSHGRHASRGLRNKWNYSTVQRSPLGCVTTRISYNPSRL